MPATPESSMAAARRPVSRRQYRANNGHIISEQGKPPDFVLEEPESGILQEYSLALNLILRWNHGRLEWLDPGAGRHIPTLDDERDRRGTGKA